MILFRCASFLIVIVWLDKALGAAALFHHKNNLTDSLFLFLAEPDTACRLDPAHSNPNGVPIHGDLMLTIFFAGVPN